MKRDRTLQTFLLTILLISLCAIFRQVLVDNTFYFGNVPTSFWVNKANAEPIFDMVIAGDSRVYRGISPEDMQAVLGDEWNILNFGFSSGGLNPEIYQIVETKLDPRGRRIVMLGITPHSLTPASLDNGHYRSVANERISPLNEIFSINLDAFFQPITLTELNTMLTNTPPETYYYQEPRTNGWIASFRHPIEIERGIEAYSTIFEHNRIMPELLNELIAQVDQWIDNEICVYAFRAPAVREVMQLEDIHSGFDETTIRNQIGEQGGIWLEIDYTAYSTYDGNHLDIESARRLSRDLARLMQLTPCQVTSLHQE